MKETSQLRPIQIADNPQMAKVIRDVMTEFGAVGEGYSIQDPEVDQMYETYNTDRSRFFVITQDGKVLGGGGVAPLAGGDPNVCELKKMYFYPALRGKGWGKKMVAKCLETAKELGYQQCYLETIPRMESANILYKKMGFRPLNQAMGNTGHSACQSFYLIDLL